MDNQKKKMIGFVCNDHKKQLLKQLNNLEKFEVTFFCLKYSDKLDLITEGVEENQIVDYPTLYSEYVTECNSFSFKEIIKKVQANEEKYSIRSVNKLISYNYARSVNPDERLENVYRLIWIEQRMLIELIHSIKPHCMLGELSRSYFLVSYDICKGLGITYFHPIEYRSSYYGSSLYTLYDDNGTKLGYEEKYHSLKNGDVKPSKEAIGFYENFIENIFNPMKFKNKKLAHFSDDWSTIFKKIKYRKSRIRSKLKARTVDNKYNPEKKDYKNILYALIDRAILRKLKYKYNYFRAQKFFVKDYNLKELEFVYFPLHFYPEMVSSVWANNSIHYFDQELHLIQLISKNLPSGKVLCVKEHLPMVRNRKIDFYKKVSSLNNVKLLSPFADNFELIRQSNSVCTISSTTGFEAFLLKKPVLTFHGSFYKFLPNIISTNDFNSVSHTLNSFNGHVDTKDEDIKNALLAFYDSSIPFDQEKVKEDSLDIIYKHESIERIETFLVDNIR